MNSKYMNDAELSARDDIARIIRERKKETGMTIEQLAIKSNLTSAHVCGMYSESSSIIPSFRSMIRILDALGLKEVTIRWK